MDINQSCNEHKHHKKNSETVQLAQQGLYKIWSMQINFKPIVFKITNWLQNLKPQTLHSL